MSINDPSSLASWVQAARPQTLPAAWTPVCIGSAIAFYEGGFSWLVFGLAVLSASLIQIGTNFANDYFDAKTGADADRIGFERPTTSGAISSTQMAWATVIAMILAFTSGLGLVWIAGTPILWIGLASLFFGIIYTGGPFPLAYNGLGDLFVWLFFGVIAVMGTTYAHLQIWSETAFWLGSSTGALCINILVANNLRDIHTDRKAHKRTLGVLLGERFLKGEYTFMIGLALAVHAWLFVASGFEAWWTLMILGVLPFTLRPLHQIWTHQDKALLNGTLKQSALVLMIYGLVVSLSLYASTIL